MRNDSKRTSNKKLSIKRETLRKMQLRTLSNDELGAAHGGLSGTCTFDHCAPSHCGC